MLTPPIEYQVKCIVSESDAAGERIAQVGGAGWQKKLSDVLYEMGLGVSTFYTFVDGVRAEIIRVAEGNELPYLRTTADTEQSNNLLLLPQCPRRLP